MQVKGIKEKEKKKDQSPNQEQTKETSFAWVYQSINFSEIPKYIRLH